MGFKAIDYINKKKLGMGRLLRGEVVPHLVNQAKENAYWKDRSGHARNGINGGSEGGNGQYTVYLAHGTEYGEWLEKGTGIYGPTGKLIVPINSEYLCYFDAKGQFHKRKSVRGIKPMPIIEDTLNNNKEFVIQAIAKYWGEG